MQSGEHQVTGQSRLDADFRGLEVADLADQNNIGVLAEKSSERSGEVQANLLFHLHLVDSTQLKLDGIFRGHDVGVDGVQGGDGGVQGVGFPRTRRTGHQHHAVGFHDVAMEFLERRRFETELGHVQAEVFLVEQPQDDLFAVQRGHGGHAEVQFLLLAFGPVLDHDAAVLRQALFRDVQLGHDLYAAGYRVLQTHGRRHDGLELPVNSETHTQFRLVGLNVNVARAALDGIGQNQVDELDDGSFFGSFFERRRIELRLLCCQLQFLVLFGQVFHQVGEFLGVGGCASVETRDGIPDGRFRGHHRFHIETGHELDVIHCEDVGRIRHGNGQNRTDARQRNDLITRGGVLRDQLDDVGIYFVILQVDRGNAVLPREHTGDVVIADEAHSCQAASKFAPVGALELQSFLELVLGYQTFFNEYLAETDGHPQHSLEGLHPTPTLAKDDEERQPEF